MKKIYLALLIPCYAAAAPTPEPFVSSNTVTVETRSAPAVTLQECYRQALKVSETLQINEETIRQLEIQYRQGIGSVLPSLYWIKTQEFQDTPESSQSSSSGSVQGTLLRSPIPQSYLLFEQPLFHGLREFNAVKGYKYARESGEKARDHARLSLLSDVAQVFYTSIDLQEELALYNREHVITEDRLKQLQHWVDLGRSRSSEVLSTQVDLVSLEAQMEKTRGALQTARLTLEFLTQISPTVPLLDSHPAPVLAPLDQVLLKSVNRPDLAGLALDRRSAEYRIKYAQGDYWPSLDFAGRWYTERVGFQEDDRWDALFTLKVPIFTGGSSRLGLQLARSQLKIIDLNYTRLQRQVQQDVKNAYQALDQSVRQAALYEKAAALARKNYEAQQKEYRLGLITNLEVLQVLKTLEDLEIQRLRTQATSKLNDVNLHVTIGEAL
jgi:outer membrane protein